MLAIGGNIFTLKAFCDSKLLIMFNKQVGTKDRRDSHLWLQVWKEEVNSSKMLSSFFGKTSLTDWT